MVGQPGSSTTRPCGAIVKYNPCTRYARGSPCLYFDGSKKCDKPLLACEMPEYDKWYKDVLDGTEKCFYPNRLRLLENPGVPMFLFHTHHHAIVGEARISRYTLENGDYFYWFDEFVSYLHPVQLELLETDPRLPKMAKKGRWLCVYISEDTIREMRHLSKLSVEERKKLGKDLNSLIEQPKKFPPRRPRWELFMRRESKVLEKKYGIDEEILAETQKYFSKAIQKKPSIRHSLDELFYGSLYLTFRKRRIPTLLNDITRLSNLSRTKLLRAYRLLLKKLELAVPLLDPIRLIESYSERLDISGETTRRAISIAENARKKIITSGKAPSSIAAASTFVASQKEREQVTQKQIAEIFDVSTVTVRNLARKLETL